MRLGFGFVETGTVTPRPQQGNPRPRLFRLEEDRAVINRMGFNNAGLEAYRARLAALPRPLPAVLGGNIGVNKEGAVPERDYPALYAALAGVTDYIVVNVSSPNTPGLRDLQGEERLVAILDAVAAVRQPGQPPLLVKIAPDLAEDALGPVVEACAARGVAGLIVSNTTIARPETLRSRHRREAGGLSGPPLFERSTEMLRQVHRLSRGRLALIGVGGVASGMQAYAKIRAGASLVQLYAGFAYEGPALIPRIKAELAALLRRDGLAHVADAVGADA
jgi:dihydroorotate dehydrogenase